MLGKVNAKMNVIDQMIDFYEADNSNLKTYYDQLNSTFANKQGVIQSKVNDYLQAQLKCMHDNMESADGAAPNCADYNTAAGQLLQTLSEEAYAKADRDEFLWNAVNRDSYIQYLRGQKDELVVQHNKLYAMLGEMDPFMDGILEADQLAIANLSDTYKDDNWLQFSFDSTEDYGNTDQSSSSESISASGGIHILFFHIGGSYSYSFQADIPFCSTAG